MDESEVSLISSTFPRTAPALLGRDMVGLKALAALRCAGELALVMEEMLFVTE
jgi:hypothetical protein